MVLHEKTYKGFGISKVTHKRRLKKILAIFNRLDIKTEGRLADFGCSDGYIISRLQQLVFRDREWEFYGFDLSEELEVAKNRHLPKTRFYYLDLDSKNDNWFNYFDIVICFETLEHVANYANALDIIYKSCKREGFIILSIPNERGIVGLVKYLGRKLLRRSPYGDFFDGKSKLKYVWHLIMNKPIDIFRQTEKKVWGLRVWGVHLGFDWKIFKAFLVRNFIKNGKCVFLVEDNSFLKFNHLYVLKKLR